jgi:hypothetical protein
MIRFRKRLLLALLMALIFAQGSSGQSPVEQIESGFKDITIYKAPISNVAVIQGEKGDWGHESTSEDLLKKNPDFYLATNGGMYMEEGKHVGMLKKDNVLLSPKNRYTSFLCLDPFHEQKPGIYNDLKGHGIFKTVVQNLASVSDGENAWEGGRNIFGSIVLATKSEDSESIFFIIATKGRTGARLADILIELGFTNAQHLEGGPEAQLSLRTMDKKKEVIENHQACFEGGIHDSYDCGSMIHIPWFLVVSRK